MIIIAVLYAYKAAAAAGLSLSPDNKSVNARDGFRDGFVSRFQISYVGTFNQPISFPVRTISLLVL